MSDTDTFTLDEQAMEWVRVLADATGSQREEFGFWVRRSPEHLAAYLKHRALSTELAKLDPRHQVDAFTLIACARYDSQTNSSRPRPSEAAPLEKRRPRTHDAKAAASSLPRYGIAASLAVFALLSSGLWLYLQNSSGRTTVYSTTVGQQRSLQLADGSRIELNTDSSVRIAASASVREVYLLSGEALFDVKHNAAFPFRVHVNGTLIEDLGTQFSVHRRGDSTTVSVIEGLVQVSADSTGISTSSLPDPGRLPDVVVTTKEFQPLRRPTQVAAGEQVSIVADGALMEKRALDIAQATAWRHGRVAFNGATLEEIVTEFNRYNVRKIRIHGEALKERRYTGVFDARDPQSFIDFLREDKGIEIEDSKDSLVLSHH